MFILTHWQRRPQKYAVWQLQITKAAKRITISFMTERNAIQRHLDLCFLSRGWRVSTTTDVEPILLEPERYGRLALPIVVGLTLAGYAASLFGKGYSRTADGLSPYARALYDTIVSQTDDAEVQDALYEALKYSEVLA